MSDYNKTDIGSGYNTQDSINTELGKIETAVNSKVDKTGSTMSGDIDMNSNQILNLPAPVTNTEPLRKGDISSIQNIVVGYTAIDTAVDFIASSSSPALNDIVEIQGYTTKGDGGKAAWRHNGLTNQTPSQSPAQLGDALINDASGNQWEYMPILGGVAPLISAAALGVVGSGDKDAEIEAAQQFAQNSNGGTILLPSGSIDHSSTINMKVGVTLKGAGRGNQSNPSSSVGTTLNWTGGASTQIQFNGAGTVYWGGGLDSLTIDSNRLATVGLLYKDWQGSRFENIEIRQPLTTGLHLTNTAGTADPTGKAEFINVNINVRAGTPTTTDAILIDGKGSGAEGVTLCNFWNIDINHDNGDGVKFLDRGDNFTWWDLNCFRPDTATGFGVNTASTNPPSGIACARNIFVRPNLTGGMNIHKEGAARDWEVWNINDLEVGSSVGTAIISGAGKNDVRGYTRGGRMYGTEKIYSPLITMSHENCNGLFFDSTNEIIHTADGNFMVSGDTGYTIGFGVLGGAIVATTNNTINDEITVAKGTFSGTALAGGTATAYEPYVSFVVNPTITLVSGDTLRAGLIGDTTGVGVYLESAPGTNANYQLVCDDGSRTAVATGIGANQLNVQWRLSVTSTEAIAWYRVTGTLTWSDPIKVTTNIPATNIDLAPAFYLQTGAAAIKRMQIKDLKYASSTEVTP